MKKPSVHKRCQLYTSNKNSILKLRKYISEAFVMRKDFNMIDWITNMYYSLKMYILFILFTRAPLVAYKNYVHKL